MTEDVVIQRKTTVDDGGGYKVPKWVTILAAKGRLDALSGSEKYIADRKEFESSHVLYCLPFTLMMNTEEQTYFFGSPFQPAQYGLAKFLPADINEKDRLLCRGGIYNIRFIDNPMGLNRHLEIYVDYLESEQQ